ncbi:MAG: acetylglutamate kinase [Dehalococcoidia bacterium]
MRERGEQRGEGGLIVVKIGGSTLGSGDTTLEDLVTLQQQGIIPVVVHGGGKLINQWLARQGRQPGFVRGLRVTDAASLEVVTAVLAGLVNKSLVASILAKGGRAMGFSGVDGAILEASIADAQLGLVGQVVRVNPQPLLTAVETGYIPVIAPVGIHCLDGSSQSGTLLNINGDTAAGEVAGALGAQRLIYLTDVQGVLDTSGRLMERLTVGQARALVQSGVVSGGMVPKLEGCIKALGRVLLAQIVDGRVPRALLTCLSDSALGTRVQTSFP